MEELFWHRRAELDARVRYIAFGHNLYEKALEPHIGMVAKTVFIPFAEGAEADARVAAHFSQRANFPRPKAMAPMPVLGIPDGIPIPRSRASTTTPATSAARARSDETIESGMTIVARPGARPTLRLASRPRRSRRMPA
jgi:hypothetical protein